MQEIIVYNNPVQAFFWTHIGWVAVMVVWFVLWYFIMVAFQKHARMFVQKHTKVAGPVAAILALIVLVIIDNIIKRICNYL